MSAWEDYITELRSLWREAGEPSSRELKRRSEAELLSRISHTTIAEMLAGRRLPSRDRLDVVVALLNDQAVAAMGTLWSAARAELTDAGRLAVTDSRPTMLSELQAIRRLLDDRLPLHEIACPECNAVIRARMADG